MINELLINLVDTVIGNGKKKEPHEVTRHTTAPFATTTNRNLEVNFTENKKGYNPWHCWVCG